VYKNQVLSAIFVYICNSELRLIGEIKFRVKKGGGDVAIAPALEEKIYKGEERRSLRL